MHAQGFLFGVVPILGLFYIFCMAVTAIPICNFDSVGLYVFSGVVCQIFIMGFRILWVARKSYLDFSRKHKKLPETPSAHTEDKFGIHILEETLKFITLASFVLFLAQDQRFTASYILLVSSVFAGNKLVCNMVTFSPLNYEKYYAKFTEALGKFEARTCVLNDKLSVHSEDAGSQLSEEAHTLVLQCSDEPYNAFFKLDFFNTQAESSIGVPIPGSPDPLTVNLRSIDRFYSVSPKDTIHFAHEYFLESPENCLETSSAISCGPTVEFKVPETTMKHVDVHMELNLEDSTKINDQSWWAWLFPWCNEREKALVLPHKGERALLRKKLSTFALNSDTLAEHEKRLISHGESETSSLKSACSYNLYGTIDLESQQVYTIANSHKYYEFARFANKFLDFWSPSLGGLLRCIDPAFMKFGEPIIDISPFYFIIYGASICMWQVSSTFLLAVPLLSGDSLPVLFISAFVILLTAKLFCVNYLHGQCRRSYKYSIGAEFVLNIALFVLAYSCFYRLASRNPF